MSNFSFGDMTYEPVDHFKMDQLVGLSEDLAVKVKLLIDTKLTDRQTEVVKKIFFEQKTQMEVADSLGLCQTTIHKILKGNIDYANGAKRYGGALKKLRKLCAADEGIQDILREIQEIRADIFG
jgi:hypothetical protein